MPWTAASSRRASYCQGGDGDGALGIKAIKERGGLTMAQVADGYGPQHPSMPDTAIATGLVDFALPAEAMGARLAAFARSLLVEAPGEVGPLGTPAAAAGLRQEICGILRNQVGHDFNGYKDKTFLRRVHRRMQVQQGRHPGKPMSNGCGRIRRKSAPCSATC